MDLGGVLRQILRGRRRWRRRRQGEGGGGGRRASWRILSNVLITDHGADKDVFSTNLRQQNLFLWVRQKHDVCYVIHTIHICEHTVEKKELERVNFVIASPREWCFRVFVDKDVFQMFLQKTSPDVSFDLQLLFWK